MDTQTKADELTAKYIKLRDFKDKVDAEYKERLSKVKTLLEQLEGEMLTFLNQSGQDSAKTPEGTFFKKTTTSARVADWDVTIAFILENDMLNMLEHRVNKTAVEEYISAHGTVPPGVDLSRKVEVGVHRPKARG